MAASTHGPDGDSPQGIGLPGWVDQVATSLWITDLRGRIVYLNDRARRLLGCSLGGHRPCHEICAGLDAEGLPVCSLDCPIRARARRAEPISPRVLELGPAGARSWNLVTFVPLEDPDGGTPWLVHLATDVDRARRLERYLRRVASRTPDLDGDAGSTRPLTFREVQILDLLARDQDPQAIARRLGLSYQTVRKHVQHLLAKMDVHSIDEAIARHLLEGPASESAS